MPTTITYNGITLERVNVESYTTDMVLAEDGITLTGQQFTIRGTATIQDSDAAQWGDDLQDAIELLNRPRRALVVSFGDEEVANIPEGGDDAGGPFATFEQTRLLGTNASIISFRISYSDLLYTRSGTPTESFASMSHVWESSWEFDESVRGTYTVNGTIVIKANAPDQATGTDGLRVSSTDRDGTGLTSQVGGNNPDAWRLVAVPPLPLGYRRESLRFVVDNTGNRISYTAVAREYRERLPFPVRSGDVSYRYQTSLEKGFAVGEKTMTVELSASPGTATQTIYELAILVVASRINFAQIPTENGDRDIITDFDAEELSILEIPRVRLTVKALSISEDPTSFQNPRFGKLGSTLYPSSYPGTEFQPIADTDFSHDFSPYGSFAIQAIRRQYSDPSINIVPYGETAGVDESDRALTPTPGVIVIDPPPEAPAIPILDPNELEGFVKTPEHLAYPYIRAEAWVDIEEEDTGLRVLQPSQADTVGGDPAEYQPESVVDRTYQVDTPMVLVKSVSTYERVGRSPDAQIEVPPPGATLLMERSRLSTVRSDAQGRPVYRMKLFRIFQMRRATDSPKGVWVGPVGVGDALRYSLSRSGRGAQAPRDPRVVASDVIANDVYATLDPDNGTGEPRVVDYKFSESSAFT